MLKGIIVFLLLMMPAMAAFSADRVDVARIDRDSPLLKKNSVVSPVVTEKYEYYEIKGDCEKELHGELCKNGCKWNDGKKFDSVTTWDVKWDYGYDLAPQTCTADSFKVTVDIVYRYPKWVRSGDAPRPLAEKWDRYMQNLIAHENGHRDIVVEAATELSRAVAGLPPAATCVEIDRNVRALCRERMEKLNEDQKGYDAATQHGVTQGAVFP